MHRLKRMPLGRGRKVILVGKEGALAYQRMNNQDAMRYSQSRRELDLVDGVCDLALLSCAAYSPPLA